MNDRERDALIEGAVTAHRRRDPDGLVLPSPDWYDLAPADRDALFERQMESRVLERGVDAESLSSTARAVMERIRRVRGR